MSQEKIEAQELLEIEKMTPEEEITIKGGIMKEDTHIHIDSGDTHIHIDTKDKPNCGC